MSASGAGAGRAEVLAEVAALGLPVFVKPAHLGSSVGIVEGERRGGVRGALEGAFAHDALVIVEALAGGGRGRVRRARPAPSPPRRRLATDACRMSAAGRSPAAFASEPGEIVFAGDWYDYAAKYTRGAWS